MFIYVFVFFKPAEKAEFEAQGFGFLSYKNVLHFCTQDCFKNFYWKKLEQSAVSGDMQISQIPTSFWSLGGRTIGFPNPKLC